MEKDLVPEKLKTELLEGHLDYKRLQKASQQTGIIDQLERAKLRHITLNPRWGTRPDKPTAYPAPYWLNPHDQKNREFGW